MDWFFGYGFGYFWSIVIFSKKKNLVFLDICSLDKLQKIIKERKNGSFTHKLVLFVHRILTIFSIHTGNTEFDNLKEQVITHLNSEGMLIDSEVNYETLNKLLSNISVEYNKYNL